MNRWKRYRKKWDIEIIQWDGRDETFDAIVERLDWRVARWANTRENIMLPTQGGPVNIAPGDFIGVEDGIPFKLSPSEIEKYYEEVSNE